MTFKRIALALGGLLALAFLVIVVLTLLGPSIGEVGPKCTAMLCENGFRVQFSGSVPSDYTAEVTGSDGQHFTATCHIEPGKTIGNNCLPGGGVDVQMTSPEVTITVRWSGGSKTQVFHPTYQHLFPNGTACPGDCQRADNQTMSLP